MEEVCRGKMEGYGERRRFLLDPREEGEEGWVRERSEEKRREMLEGSRGRAKEWRDRKRVERRVLEAKPARIASAGAREREKKNMKGV